MTLRSDLPIKYYLLVHNEDRLHDELSSLFDILQYLNKVLQAKGKAASLDSFKFTSNSLKYVFGDRLKDETFKQILVKKIKTLIAQEYILVEGEQMKITQKALTNFYILE
jgi:tyrosine-protein phosphatase YwqE